MIEKAVKSCLETEKQLKDQMATLKKNRDNVPLDVLKTKYKKDSGLLKECSKAVYRQQDFEELKSLAEQLRELALKALDEFYMKHIGLYIAPECLKEPYPPPYYLNLVTNQYYDGTRWAKI